SGRSGADAAAERTAGRRPASSLGCPAGGTGGPPPRADTAGRGELPKAASTPARLGRSAAFVTALSLLAAASTCPSPGPVRRRVLPGVRSRPVDEPGLQAGYLPEGTADTRAPQTANGGGPCFSPPETPRPAPPRSPRAAVGPPHSPAPAGGRSAGRARLGCPAG